MTTSEEQGRPKACLPLRHPPLETLYCLQGLPKYIAQIEEVSEYASKEYSLERTLDKMQGG